MCGNGVTDRDPQIIWNPRKNCGSFVDATSSEPQQIRPTLVFRPQGLIDFLLTPKHVTLYDHFALNSVLRRYVWSSEAWLSKLGYSLKLVMNVVGEL